MLSEETARGLADAKAAEAEQKAKVDQLKQDALGWVADRLPENVDTCAKNFAQSQPAATKKLGSEGLTRLRKALAGEAEKLGAVLKASADKIDWTANYEGVTHQIIQFLSKTHRVGPFNQTLREVGGFAVDQRASVSEWDLLGDVQFPQLQTELRKLEQLTAAVKSAQKAHDLDSVDSMWDESSR